MVSMPRPTNQTTPTPAHRDHFARAGRTHAGCPPLRVTCSSLTEQTPRGDVRTRKQTVLKLRLQCEQEKERSPWQA